MTTTVVTGWDLGGAHLKVAQADSAGRLLIAAQVPCRLWEGTGRLSEAIEGLRPRLRPSRRHAVTMTGELVDLFADRAAGVAALVDAAAEAFPRTSRRFFAGRAGFLDQRQAKARPLEVASANWLACVQLAASRLPEGLFLDVGSTTTDIVPFAGGRDLAEGISDAERLASGELVYDGVTRTPVMALARSLPFEGLRQGVMAEHFATVADVYRVLGVLPAGADQHPTADGRDRSVESSARRLARMLGRDFAPDELPAYRRLAAQLAGCQSRHIVAAAKRVTARAALPASAPVIGAGVGRFLAQRVAERLGRPYSDFGSLIAAEPAVREEAARAAPAAAVALLAVSAAGS